LEEFFLLQQEEPDFLLQQPDGFFSADEASSAGADTPCFFAQASFCALVKQQQRLRDCSAVRQPQAFVWQGNGCVASTGALAGTGR
jgi:hypothetical protein